MSFDQAQSPRLGQRAPVESTYVRMFSGDEIPEAAWPGQIIYRNDDQILQIYDGIAWEDVTGGDLGQLTFVGPLVPIAQHVGDIWFDSADANRMYVARSATADQILPGEWEVISGKPPPITPTTYIYKQGTPPGAGDTPLPKDNDFWYESPTNKQYYYLSSAPGTHWIGVQDTGISAAQTAANNAQSTANTANTAAGNAQSTANSAVSSAGAAQTAANNAQSTATSANLAAQTAQATADGKVTTFYQTNAPTAQATGDLWVDTDDNNRMYRWSTGQWRDIRDGTIAPAQATATAAQNLAATKVVTFYTTNASPPSALTAGDLWVVTDQGNKLRRATAAGTGSWVDIQDTSIATAQAAATAAGTSATNANLAAQTAQATADGKVLTFYQTNTPTASENGDLWVDTDDNNRMYRWDAPLGMSTITNRISNPSFESGFTTGWGVIGADTNTVPAGGSIPALFGTRAMQCVTTGANFGAYVGSPTVGGQSHAFAPYVYSLVAQNFTITASEAGPSAGAGSIVGSAITSVPANTWTRLNPLIGVTPAAETSTNWIVKAATASTFYVDGVMAVLGTTLPPYFDGSTGPRMAWSGTVNASQSVYTPNWIDVRDGTIATAQAVATAAQNLAATKITTFWQTNPPTSLAAGDLWVDTDDSNHTYRAASPGVTTVGATGWVDIRDATISVASGAAAAAQTTANNAMTAAQAAQATADGAITTYYLSSPPWANGTTGKANNAGDMWYDTDDGQAYRWNDNTKNWDVIEDNSIGVALAAAQNAQTTADSKIVAWYNNNQPWANGDPTHSADAGDLWFDLDDGNKAYYYTGSTWALVRDTGIATAQAAADAAQSTANAAVIKDSLAANPLFDDWPAGQARPTGYPGGSGAAPIKETTILRTAPYAFRITHVTTGGSVYVDCGSAAGNAWAAFSNESYITATIVFQLISGDLVGAGFIVRWNNTVGGIADGIVNLNTEVPSPVFGKWYQITKVLPRPGFGGTFQNLSGLVGTINGYFAPTTSVKDMVIDQFSARPSTQAEIAAYLAAPQSTVTALTSTVNTKIQTFYQQSSSAPTAITVGDLWVVTDLGNKLRRATAIGTGSWVDVQDAAIGIANTSQPELIVNGGFDIANPLYPTLPMSWGTSANATRVVDAAGITWGQLDLPGGASTRSFDSTRVPVIPGQTLGITLVWQQTAGPLCAPTARFNWYDTATAPANYDNVHHKWQDLLSETSSAPPAALNLLQTYYQQITVPVGMNFVHVTLYAGERNIVGARSYQFDRLSVLRMDANTLAGNVKVNTFYQSTTPTAKGDGDLWVNTANGNRMSRWSNPLSWATSLTNLATNPSMEVDLTNWSIQWWGPSGGGTTARTAAAALVGGFGYRKTWTIAQSDSDTGFNYQVRTGITAGKYYAFRAAVRASKPTGMNGLVTWLDATLTAIGSVVILPGYTYGGANPVVQANTWYQVTGVLQAPAGAIGATFAYGAYSGGGTGATTSWAIGDTHDADAVLVCEVPSATSPVPPYFDGSTNAPNTAWAGTAHASTSSYVPAWLDVQDNSIVTAQSTANAAVIKDSANKNPLFDDWPVGQAYPTAWPTIYGTAPVRETTVVRSPGISLRFNNTGGQDQWITSNNNLGEATYGLPNYDYVTVTIEFQLVSGGLTGSGLVLRWSSSGGQFDQQIRLANEVPSPTLGTWYRVTKTLPRPPTYTGTYQWFGVFIMGGYSLFGTAAKNLVYDQVSVRQATSAEIAAYKTISDGVVPGAMGAVTVINGLRSLYLKWDAVVTNASGGAQPDQVSYEIYLTNGDPTVPQIPANLLTTVVATMANCAVLPDQTPFAYGNTYFFVVVPKDADGRGTGSPVSSGTLDPAGVEDIAVGAVTADKLESTLVLSTRITTRPQVGDVSTGAGIELDGDKLVAYDSTGRATMEITPNQSPAATFRGDADFDNLNVRKSTSLQATTLGQGATFTMQNAVSNPTALGTATTGYFSDAYADDGLWAYRYGWAVSPSKTYAFTCLVTGSKWYIERWNLTTKTKVNSWFLATSAYLISATTVYAISDTVTATLIRYGSSSGQPYATTNWRFSTYDPVAGVNVDYWWMGSGTAGAVPMNTAQMPGAALDVDGTTVVFSWTDYATGFLSFARGVIGATHTTVALSGSKITTPLTYGAYNHGSLLVGTFDFSATRWLLWMRSSNGASAQVAKCSVFDANGVEQVNDEFPRYIVNGTNGAWWTGTQFKSQQMGPVISYEIGGNKWTTESGTWWLTHAWTNTGPSRTSGLGPPRQLAMPKRARVTYLPTALVPGTSGADVYLARADVAPALTSASWTFQGAATISGVQPSLTISNANFGSPVASPANGFIAATATPAAIVSDPATNDGVGSLISMKGDGSWRLAPLGSHFPLGLTLPEKFDTGWQELAPATGITKSVLQWRRIGSIVHLRASISPNTAISYTTTGSITDTILTAALPPEVRPSFNIPIAISNGGRTGMGYVNSVDGLYRLQTTDGYGTANVIAAGTNLTILGFWLV